MEMCVLGACNIYKQQTELVFSKSLFAKLSLKKLDVITLHVISCIERDGHTYQKHLTALAAGTKHVRGMAPMLYVSLSLAPSSVFDT